MMFRVLGQRHQEPSISKAAASKVFSSKSVTMGLRSQIDCGTLDRSDNGKTLIRKRIFALQGPDLVHWMAREPKSVGRPLGLKTLEAKPIIYPFGLGENLGFVLSSATYIDLRTDGVGSQIVSNFAQ